MTDREIDGHIETNAHRPSDKQTEQEADRQTENQRDVQIKLTRFPFLTQTGLVCFFEELGGLEDQAWLVLVLCWAMLAPSWPSVGFSLAILALMLGHLDGKVGSKTPRWRPRGPDGAAWRLPDGTYRGGWEVIERLWGPPRFKRSLDPRNLKISILEEILQL